MYDTWHTEREIHELCEHGRGLKKLANFITKERQRAEERESVTIEEVEQMNVGLEMDRQEREEWLQAEKIIASEEANAYLVRQLQRLRRRRRSFRLADEEDDTEEERKIKEADATVKREDDSGGMKTQNGAAAMELDEQKEPTDVKMEPAVKGEEEVRGSKDEGSPMEAEVASGRVEAEAAAFADGQQAMEEEQLAEEAVAEEDEDEEENDEDDGSTVTRYLVKWRGLPHEECTWECADDIAAYQSAIDAFLDLEQLTTTKQPPAVVSKKFRVLTEQPAYLNAGELREYQMEGLNWLLHNWCRGINGILADEVSTTTISLTRHKRKETVSDESTLNLSQLCSAAVRHCLIPFCCCCCCCGRLCCAVSCLSSSRWGWARRSNASRSSLLSSTSVTNRALSSS